MTLLASYPMQVPQVVAAGAAVLGFAIYGALQLLDLETSRRSPNRQHFDRLSPRTLSLPLLVAAGVGIGAMIAIARGTLLDEAVTDTLWMLVVLLFHYAVMVGLTLPLFGRIHRRRARARDGGVPERNLRRKAWAGVMLIPLAVAAAVGISWLWRFG